MGTTKQKTVNRAVTTQPAAARKSIQRKAISVTSPLRVQMASRISSPNDSAEKEADATANRIMRMAIPDGPIQRREARSIQRKATDSVAPSTVPPIVNSVLQSSGQPLDSATRAFFEPRFGHDFRHVRVHTDVKAAESAQAINALAYTVGRDVVFGAGQYRPGTQAGKHLLAHELTHVVQQGNNPASVQSVVWRQVVERYSEIAASGRAGSFSVRLTITDAPDFGINTLINADINRFIDAANAGILRACNLLPLRGGRGTIHVRLQYDRASLDVSRRAFNATLTFARGQATARVRTPPFLAGVGDLPAGIAETPDWLFRTILGGLAGEWNPGQTYAMTAVDTGVSIIPGLDQVADVRDITAHIYYLNHGDSNPERWLGVGFTLIGLIPTFGSVIKAASKLLLRSPRGARVVFIPMYAFLHDLPFVIVPTRLTSRARGPGMRAARRAARRGIFVDTRPMDALDLLSGFVDFVIHHWDRFVRESIARWRNITRWYTRFVNNITRRMRYTVRTEMLLPLITEELNRPRSTRLLNRAFSVIGEYWDALHSTILQTVARGRLHQETPEERATRETTEEPPVSG